MAKKENYSYKTRRLDTLTNRLMIVFGLLIVSVWALLSARRWLTANNWLSSSSDISYLRSYVSAVKFLPLIGLLITAAALYYFLKCKKSGLDERLKVLSSPFLLCVSLSFLFIVLIIARLGYSGYIPAIVFVILISLLYFIAVSFPGSYLAVTVFNALGAFTIYALHFISRIDSPVAFYATNAVMLTLVFVILLLLFTAKRNQGEIRGIKLFNPDTDYLPLFISALVLTAFIALGMLGIGSYILFDVIIALETIIFALFYAIKMLK